MKRTVKNLAALFLVIALMGIGISAFAEQDIVLPLKLQIIEEEAFYADRSIERVVLQEGASEIRSRAFAQSGLIEIVLPSSLRYIAADAFEGCKGLKAVVIDGSYAEEYCEDHGIQYISGASAEADFQTGVLTDGTLEIVKYTGTESRVVVPAKIGGKRVTAIGKSAFFGCETVEEVVIPCGITSIGNYAFERCSRLQEVILPEGVISIGKEVFDYCSSLTKMVIPSSVISMGHNGFYGCDELVELIIPGGLVGSVDCGDSVQSVTIQGDVESFGGVFRLCDSLREVLVIGNVKTINGGGELVLGDDAERAFEFCRALESVTITGNVGMIEKFAFQSCESLKGIVVRGSLGLIEEHAFYDCYALEYIDVSVGSIVLENCFEIESDALRYVNCPDGVILTDSRIFYGCSQLKSIKLSEENVEIPSEAFRCCSGLEEIVIPEKVTKIGRCAFEYCSSLTSIVIPEAVEIIEGSAFSECENLQRIQFPEEMTELGNGAFEGCVKLEAAKLPRGIETIQDRTFANCTGLKWVYVPSTVTSIAQYGTDGIGNWIHAFYQCGEVLIFGSAGSYAEEYARTYFREGEYDALYESGDYLYTLDAVEQENGIEYQCKIAKYSGRGGVVVLPQNIDGYPVTGIHRWAFSRCSEVMCLNIHDGVTSIDSDALAYTNSEFYVDCSMASYARKYAQENGIEFYLYDNDPEISGLYDARVWKGYLTSYPPVTLLELNNEIAEKLWGVDAYAYFKEHPLKALSGACGESILSPGSSYQEYYEEAALVMVYYLCGGHESEAQKMIDTLTEYKRTVDRAKLCGALMEFIKLGHSGSLKVGDVLDAEYLKETSGTLASSLEDQILNVDLSVFNEMVGFDIQNNMDGVYETLVNSCDAIIDAIMVNVYRNTILDSLGDDLEQLLSRGGYDANYTAVINKLLSDLRKDQVTYGKECFLKAEAEAVGDVNITFGVWSRSAEAVLEGSTDATLVTDAIQEELTEKFLLDAWLPGKAAKVGFNIGTGVVEVFLFDTDEIGLQMRNFSLSYATASNAYAQLEAALQQMPMMIDKTLLSRAVNYCLLYYDVVDGVFDIGEQLIEVVYHDNFNSFWNELWNKDDPAVAWLAALRNEAEIFDNQRGLLVERWREVQK